MNRVASLKSLTALVVVLSAFGREGLANDSNVVTSATTQAGAVLPPLHKRFTRTLEEDAGEVQNDDSNFGEVPDFQKHVTPLFGRLGCNGRACHGSFQGQGGFQLSLFGYDFNADYEALLEDGAGRVDLDDRPESLILAKPIDADVHDGGQRFEEGGWEYWVLRSWIEAGAPFNKSEVHKLRQLEVSPAEIQFAGQDESVQLKVIAHWEDGTSEDVTCLSRFHTNDESIARIDESGLVRSGAAGDTHVVVTYDKAVVPVQTLRAVSELHGDQYPSIAAATKIDELILHKLRKLGIVPAELCSDEAFLRRASLDATGTLPSPAEIVAFQHDTSPDKRQRMIDQLLQRPTHAAHWATFLCDMTGNNEDQLRNFLPQGVNPASHWYHWIFDRLQKNVPYDEIVEGIVMATSRAPGESYEDYCEIMSDVCRDTSGKMYAERPGMVYYWARNNFRTPEDRAIGFAYSFLGVRIQCAQCHKHPFDQWSKNDFDEFEKLFTSVQARQNTISPEAKRDYAAMIKELNVDKKLRGNQLRREFSKLLKEGQVVPMPELVVARPRANRDADGAQAKLLGSDWVDLSQSEVRDDLMDWLRSPENPYFAKAIVNRVWAQYFGVGIVNPPDDLNLANAPSNGPLLEYLADEFRNRGFDLRWLHREIMSSDAYQRSWQPNETNANDKSNFSVSQLRRLSAEATYDALRVALAKDAIAEQYRNLERDRAITLPGSSARTNRRDDQSYALRVFGRSVRESNCDCDRSNEPSLLQTVFLANDSAVQDWLTNPKTSWASQVASKFGWEKDGGDNEVSEDDARFQALAERFVSQRDAIDLRLANARKQGNRKMVRALQKRKQDLLSRGSQVAEKQGFAQEFQAFLMGQTDKLELDRMQATALQIQWVAEQAYLRTLSRQPSDDELSKVVAFFEEESNPVVAVEGLLWSLVNTKEFILNH